MQKYRVVERRSEDSRITLRCGAGSYHVARALSVLPKVDERLEGNTPHLGFGILLCPNTGAIFRVIFESIGNAEIPVARESMPFEAYLPQGTPHRARQGAFSGTASAAGTAWR